MTVQEGESENQDPGWTEADVRMCVWRVYGVSNAFTHRPADVREWSTHSEVGPAPGDQLSLTIGDLPAEVVTAIRAHRALWHLEMSSLLGISSTDSAEERDIEIDRLIADADDVEEQLRRGYSTWVTLEIARPMYLMIDPSRRHEWLRDPRITAEGLDEFAKAASDYLDVAIARLLPVTRETLRPDRVVMGRRQAFLMAYGRGPLTIPRSTFSASGLTAGGKWNELPFADIASTVASLPIGVTPSHEYLRSSARWLSAALTEEDPLRRFQFAFFGLETLVNKLAGQIKPLVIRELTTASGGLPMQQLMWPTPKDADSPWRNLTFKFAMLAVHVSSDTSGADVEEFQALAKRRNQLSHGDSSEDEVDTLPAWPAIDLLQRYLSHVVTAHTRGRLT